MSLSPELLWPFYRHRNVSLRQTLCDNATNRKLKLLTTFIPDQLIFLIEQKAKLAHYDFVIFLYIEFSSLSFSYEEFCSRSNNECCEFSKICNSLISKIVEQICCEGGDVIKITDNGILTVWTQDCNQLVHELMCTVISCSFTIKDILQKLKGDFHNLFQTPLKFAIAAGSISFSMIGDNDALHYVIAGEPLAALRRASEIYNPQDVILTASAWEHCNLSDYVYVILDKSHIKIIRELKKCTVQVDDDSKMELNKSVQSVNQNSESDKQPSQPASDVSSIDMKKVKIIPIDPTINVVEDLESNRPALMSPYEKNIVMLLRSFVVDSIVKQIDKELSFEYMTELRNVTVVHVEIASMKSTASDLISQTDECHKIILATCESAGCIEDISLRDSIVIFRIVFGIRSYLKDLNHCQFAVRCARNLLRSLESVTNVRSVAVGVSTGISCVTVIGHTTRHQYKVIGAPIIKAENMMPVSRGKVTCDLDTVIHSDISKSYYICNGLVNLGGSKKDYIFHYNHRNDFEVRAQTELKDAYPILNRFDELELFSEILDDIGIPDRQYAGILIEGKARIGKSRLLDGFVTFAKARRMSVVKIVLHPTFALKPYAVIYKILEQILEAEWCKTIDEFERNIVQKLGHTLLPEELCYMNRILRVRFKHTKEYLVESDWNRHKKALDILDKILDNDEKRCILLDNVEHMDYMSWQFLSQAISHENVTLAMTILEAKSWEELSRVEADICRDKRLLQHKLSELQSSSLSALACQFLSVQALASELHVYLMRAGMNHPGRVELFLSLMILCCAFDVVQLTPVEAEERQLIFPDVMHTTRIPADLLPEETAPPQPLNKRDKIDVCLINDKFRIANSFTRHGIRELSLEIYSRLSTYEQDVVRCASLIGKVFLRKTLELILPDHESLRTSAAVENLMRIRILECALLQRRSTKVDDLAVCSFKPRSTFSDMHHLLRCRCHSSQSTPAAEKHLARYSQCRYMEFKISVFLQVVREQLSEQEKKDGHVLIADIYKKEAKKCMACGGGPFLRQPDKEKSIKQMKRPILKAERPIDDRDTKEHLAGVKSARVSIDERQSSGSGQISIMPSSIETDVINDKQPTCGEMCAMSPKARKQYLKKSKVHPLAQGENDRSLPLNNFGHVDFRYCRCLSVINGIFLKLQQHISQIDNNQKIINFMMEYAAALIDYGQPGFALRFLALADERNEYVGTYDSWKNPSLYGKMLKKATILRLRGNAYMLLGNYPQAKTNYAESLSLFKHNLSTSEWFSSHKAVYEKIRQNIRWNFALSTTRSDIKQERAAVVRQNTATCLSLIASILVIKKNHRAAKLASLQSVLFGFTDYDSSNFYDQCELYLSILKIYRKLGDLSFVVGVERYILHAIEQKQKWNSSEEIVMLAHVYAAIFKVSLLQGKLERAARFAEKALRLSKYFHMIRLQLDVLPLLIQTLMRLKRICETVDMLQRLRDNALEDIDKSALTWYYALCMDLMLDAGIVIESFEVCADYALRIIAEDTDVCILRDPHSTKRLITGLWSWQLRKSDLTTSTFVKSLDFFTRDIQVFNYSQVITLCKILECHLLLLTRCINLKKGKQIELLLADIDTLMDILIDLAKTVDCIKPHYYLLRSYYNLVRARTITSNSYWRKAKKCAEMQKNLMTLARIERNRNTWKAINSFNNMAHYWEENIGYRNTIVWQDVEVFDLTDWSNLMYSLPVPDSYI